MEITAGPLLKTIDSPEDLKKLPREKLHQLCDELRQYIIDVVSVHGGHFGASLGVAVYPPLEGDIDALMNRADQAMYAAKRAGKGRLHYAQTA